MPLANIVARKVRAPAGLPPYLASLYETPLLTRGAGAASLPKIQLSEVPRREPAREIQSDATANPTDDEIERLHEQAVATKNQIIEANLRLVVSIMKR